MKNKKVYVLYELTSEFLACDTGADKFEILGIFQEKEKAHKEKIKRIDIFLKDDYLLDEQCENMKNANNVILFFNKQENWSEYIEIIIQEFEIL